MAGSGDEARADAQPGPLASIVVSATPVNEHNPELASVESEPEQPIIVTAMAGSGDEARADAQPGALASIVVATPVYERNPELAFVPVVPLVPVTAVQSAAARVAATALAGRWRGVAPEGETIGPSPTQLVVHVLRERVAQSGSDGREQVQMRRDARHAGADGCERARAGETRLAAPSKDGPAAERRGGACRRAGTTASSLKKSTHRSSLSVRARALFLSSVCAPAN